MKSILLLQKSGPSLPDICHLGVLITWQQSAPEPEKLKWVNNGGKLNEQSRLWETQNGCSVLPGSLADPIFWFLHAFTHCSAFKMIQIMNRHWWRDFHNQSTSNVWSVTCMALEEQFLSPEASDLLPLGPLNIRGQISFIWHLVWIIDMFSVLSVCFPDGLKPSPALTVAKNLLEGLLGS